MDPVVITPQAMGSKIIDNNNNTSQRSRFNRIQTGTYTHSDLNGNKLLHNFCWEDTNTRALLASSSSFPSLVLTANEKTTLTGLFYTIWQPSRVLIWVT